MSDQFNEDVPRVAPSSLAGVIDVPTVGVLRTGLVRVLLVRVSVAVINETVPDTFGNVIVLSAVGSVTVRVISCASAVAPSNTIALDASIVTVSTVVVVPATVSFGTSSSPVLGLYRNAPVSSNNALDSLWKTTGKFVFAVLSVTVTVVAKVAVAAVPLVS